MAWDALGRLLVLDYSGDVLAYNRDTSLNSTFVSSLNRPYGITVDSNGLVYIADQDNSRTLIINPDGSTNRTIAQPNYYIYDVAVDSQFSTYTLYAQMFSPYTAYIQKRTAAGSVVYTTVLVNPYHVAVDEAFNAYVVDTSPSRVVIVSPSGSITSLLSVRVVPSHRSITYVHTSRYSVSQRLHLRH